MKKYHNIWKTDPLSKKWIQPWEMESKVVCIYCSTQIAVKRYDLAIIRNSFAQVG